MPSVPAAKSKKRVRVVKRFQLLCVAQPSVAGGWEAFCLDFDLAIQGRTFDEVRSSLESAIRSYVEDAFKEAEPDRSRLLARRAPLNVRLAWGWRFFIQAVRDRWSDDSDVAVQFPVACRA